MLLQYGPHFFSTLSEKFGQLARFFWANGLPPPLAKNFPYAYDGNNKKSFSSAMDQVFLFTFNGVLIVSEQRKNKAE